MKEFDRDLFRQRLRERRKELGLTQVQLGDTCGFMNGQEISFYEQGQRIPSLANVFSLSRALDVSVDYLIGLSEDK